MFLQRYSHLWIPFVLPTTYKKFCLLTLMIVLLFLSQVWLLTKANNREASVSRKERCFN